MKSEWPIWLQNKIKKDEIYFTKNRPYKVTAGMTHEDTYHTNKSIPELLDRALNSGKTGMYHPVSSFNSPENRDDMIDDAIFLNLDDITAWSCCYGEYANDDTYEAHSDVQFDTIGFGILWNKNRNHLAYAETNEAIVPLYRDPKDPNEICYKRKTAYPSLYDSAFKKKSAEIKPNFDLLPYMKQTQHYQKALAANDTKTIKWLESLVQQPDSKQASKSATSKKPSGPRPVPKMPELKAASHESDDYSL